MRFKPGQEVVCIGHAAGWHRPHSFLWGLIKFNTQERYAPKLNEIVTVQCQGNDPQYILLLEYAKLIDGKRYAYNEDAFQPVVPQEEIEKLLEYQPETA